MKTKLKRFLAILITAATVVCAFSSCAKEEGSVQNNNSDENLTVGAVENESIEEMPAKTEEITELVTEPEKPILTISEYTPKGSFSEGMAFVEYEDPTSRAKKYAYIDKTGKVLFELPYGYTYGFEFHDGLAVIAQERTYNYGSYKTKGYAVMDKSGKIVFDASEYLSVSRASEGVICATKTIESYNGTTNNFYILDYKGNVLATIDRGKHSSVANYMQYGTVCVDGCFYDKQGNVVKDFKDNDEDYIEQSEAGSELGIDSHLLFNRKTLKTVATYGYSIGGYSYSRPNLNGYAIFIESDRNSSPRVNYMSVVDINGNKSKHYIDGLSSFGVTPTPDDNQYSTGTDNRWVVPLQNNFHALVNEKGEFVIEPVKSQIYYMGESKYYVDETGDVIDSNGNKLFTIIENNRSGYNPDDRFNDGMVVVLIDGDDKYVSDKGVYINKLTIE